MGNVEARFLVKNFVLDEVIAGAKSIEVRPLAPHIRIPNAGDNLFFCDQTRRVRTQVTALYPMYILKRTMIAVGFRKI